MEKVLTARIGKKDSRSIDTYLADGGYAGVKRVLTGGMTPEQVIEEVKKANVRGRGGAGFSAGVKWSFLPKDTKGKPIYLLCNADESEPGTFKDRLLMENDPHQLIEGMILASYAIKCRNAYIYIRGEFYDGARILDKALEEAHAKGYLGEKILGSGFSLDITVHRGAGAYICGEETGLLNSLEGKRGEPRLKPPFPAIEGLYRMPTVVNNVETLAYLVPILERGPEWFSAVGTERSKGYKIVSVSGHVQRPGNYEVALGTTVREIIELAGGLRPGRSFMAVQPGGGSSACIFEDHLDWPYDYESMGKAGSMLGSGAFVVFDDTTDFVKAAHNLVRFFAHESCGQCTPCREGGSWLARVLDRLVQRRGIPGDYEMLMRVSGSITGLNLCALGDSIEPFLKSVLTRFPEQFTSRIVDVRESA